MDSTKFYSYVFEKYLLNQRIIDEIKYQDYPSIAKRIEVFLKEQLEKNHAEGFVLGLSGGIDSAVLACLCQNCGKKVFALIMPDTLITPDSETKDAQRMASLTGIDYKVIDIKPIMEEYARHLESDEKSMGNLRARVRTNIIYYYANARNYLVLGSSDKSEHLIGYFTKFGDGASDVTPIISLYKLQVREIAKYLQVPSDIIAKKSSPHLWRGHQAEEELGVTYEEIDSILYCLFDKGLTIVETERLIKTDKRTIERIQQLHTDSAHKRLPAQRPEGVI